MLLDAMDALSPVFVTWEPPGGALDRLTGRHDGAGSPDRPPPPRADLPARAPQIDALLSLLTDRLAAELTAAAPSLVATSNYAVGVDNVDVEAATARGIPVG